MCAVCVNALAIHHRQAAISLYSHVLCMNMATSVLHCTLDYTTSSLALACGMPMRCVGWNKNFISSLFGCATGGKLLWKIRKTRRFVATHANACVCVCMRSALVLIIMLSQLIYIWQNVHVYKWLDKQHSANTTSLCRFAWRQQTMESSHEPLTTHHDTQTLYTNNSYGKMNYMAKCFCISFSSATTNHHQRHKCRELL